MSRDELVEIICECEVSSTELAVQFDIADEYVWIPVSLIDDRWDNENGTISIVIPERFAEEKGLI